VGWLFCAYTDWVVAQLAWCFDGKDGEMVNETSKPSAAAEVLPRQPMVLSAAAEKVRAHVAQHLGKTAWVWRDEQNLAPEAVDVHVVAPGGRRKFWVLVTSGMSDQPMAAPKAHADRRYAELVMCLPETWKLVESEFRLGGSTERDGTGVKYWPVQWLRNAARYPHQLGSWVEPGTVIPNGTPPQPLSSETQLCGLLVASSTILPKDFLELRIDKQKLIRFYSLWPLYEKEIELKGKQGSVGLQAKLAKGGVTDLVDLKRKNVAKFLGLF
jgi:hypothetical protein